MKYINALLMILGLTQTSQAQQANLWGTGYWGGQQGCSTPQIQGQGGDGMQDVRSMKNQSVSKTDEKKSQISKYEKEKKLLDSKQDLLTKKVERFFDVEVSEFLLQTHFEKMNKCDDYKTYPQHQCAVTSASPDTATTSAKEAKARCDGKDDVPEKLKTKWTTDSGGYCNANSNSSRGNVQSSICNDPTLRPSEAPRYRTYSVSECTNALSEYRKNKLQMDQLQEKIEKAQDEISDLELAGPEEKLNHAREAGRDQTEGGCEECALAGRDGQFQKSNRDWWSTAVNVVGGLRLIRYGQKTDEAAQAYNAQLGRVSTTSSGYPFVNAGVSTLINGLIGANGNCSNNMASLYGIGSYGGLNGGLNSYAGYGNIYGTSYTNSYSTAYQLQQQSQSQLQAYNQIPISQQTPDIQVTIAQLQARINAMSNSNYNSTSNYGLNQVYNNAVYYPSSTTNVSTSILSGR